MIIKVISFLITNANQEEITWCCVQCIISVLSFRCKQISIIHAFPLTFLHSYNRKILAHLQLILLVYHPWSCQGYYFFHYLLTLLSPDVYVQLEEIIHLCKEFKFKTIKKHNTESPNYVLHSLKTFLQLATSQTCWATTQKSKKNSNRLKKLVITLKEKVNFSISYENYSYTIHLNRVY